jgi:hypothetical protein
MSGGRERETNRWELGLRWRDRLSGELEMIADIIEIERAKRSIRDVAVARANKAGERRSVSTEDASTDDFSTNDASMARALRAVWRSMSRREPKSPAANVDRARG